MLVQQRAHGALARGDVRGAQNQFLDVLDRGRAVEDQDTVAIGLLNLAAVLHRSGELAASRARLIELLEHQPPFAPEFAGRAEARLARGKATIPHVLHPGARSGYDQLARYRFR